MARSVISTKTPRCERCRFVPRWCICSGYQTVDCPVQVDVLMHKREQHRPTSTGHLINRLIPGSYHHVFNAMEPPVADEVINPDRTLWILHPRGGPMPTDVAPDNLQVLLLDGNWREATRMAQTVGGWGRLVKLPMTAPSRYWLRKKQETESYSTIEALLFLLEALGLERPAIMLRQQLELHVYAGLRSRGALQLATNFLATSTLPAAMPDLLAQLHQRRSEGE